MAAGRQKGNMWQERGKYCGLWAPAFLRSSGCNLQIFIVRGKISVPLNQFACRHKIKCSFKTNEKHVTY